VYPLIGAPSCLIAFAVPMFEYTLSRECELACLPAMSNHTGMAAMPLDPPQALAM
jgi:hypothetical protein